jgi:hypothetical protein
MTTVQEWADRPRELIIMGVALPLGTLAAGLQNVRRLFAAPIMPDGHVARVARVIAEVGRYAEARRRGDLSAQKPLRTDRKGSASLNTRVTANGELGPFYSPHECADEYLHLANRREPPHFIETIIFGKDRVVVMEGHLASQDEARTSRLPVNPINRYTMGWMLPPSMRFLRGTRFLHTYCDVFSTEEELDEMFDHTLWRRMRSKYGAEGTFPTIYEKVKPEVDPLQFLAEERSWSTPLR